MAAVGQILPSGGGRLNDLFMTSQFRLQGLENSVEKINGDAAVDFM